MRRRAPKHPETHDVRFMDTDELVIVMIIGIEPRNGRV